MLNTIISSILYSLILLLIEGIIFFTLLTTIFDNLTETIINNLLFQVNIFINLNYNLFSPIINSLTNIDFNNETGLFKTLAIKLYTVGTMSESIKTEQKQINLNKLKSYIFYTLIILLFIIVTISFIYINNKFYNKLSDNNITKMSVLYNLIISMVLFIIFILPISFVVFKYITNNIDINEIQIQIINNIVNLLDK